MEKIARFVIVILLILAVPAMASNIFSLIRDGRLREARDSLSDVTTASTRDGNRLFFASLLEESADKSAQLMEAALRTSVYPIYRQEIYYRLAQYYFLTGNNTRLTELVGQYMAYWEGGKYRQEMIRLSVLIDERSGAYEAAIRQADRYLLEYSDGEASQWGLIDKARIMFRYDKELGARSLLDRLRKEESGVGVPQSLYLLAVDAIDRRRSDDAIFYYNLLREAYPHAVGLETLMEKLGGLASSMEQDNAAERITGTFYSVQVGVFSQKDNAERQAGQFRVYDSKVDIGKKKISNTTYHVVYVGRFRSYDEANQFKRMLESRHKEAFQVVAR